MVRYERKYLVPYELLDRLRNRVNGFVRPDIYTNGNGSKLPQYTVRSIYFDSRQMECHSEKLEGVELRKKFRIRTYNQAEPDSVAVFEIKKKIANRIYKHRAFAWWKDVPALLATSDIEQYIHQKQEECSSLDEASRFFFHLKKRNMQPTVLVVYEREAYHGLLDDGVRITYDKNIRSMIYPDMQMMFTNHGLKHLFEKHFILEIKYFTEKMPTWAKSIVDEFKLRHEAISKYTTGFDVHQRQTVTY